MGPTDRSLVGTYRETIKIDEYHPDRFRDGVLLDDDPPDQTTLIDLFFEADGTQVTSPERKLAIIAEQARHTRENGHAG